MHWKSACFRAKPHKHAARCHKEPSGVRAAHHQLHRTPIHRIKSERAKPVIHNEQAHQDGHTARHSIQRLSRLAVRHPHKRREGHDLKEKEQRKQIPRIENAHRRPERQEIIQIISYDICVIFHILIREQRCHKPRKCSQHPKDSAKTCIQKMQPKSAHTGNFKHANLDSPQITAQQIQRHRKLECPRQDHNQRERLFFLGLYFRQ